MPFREKKEKEHLCSFSITRVRRGSGKHEEIYSYNDDCTGMNFDHVLRPSVILTYTCDCGESFESEVMGDPEDYEEC